MHYTIIDWTGRRITGEAWATQDEAMDMLYSMFPYDESDMDDFSVVRECYIITG